MDNEFYVDAIWHDKVDDKQSWKFCAGLIQQNHGIKISPSTLKKKFKEYFKAKVGIEPYIKCPECGGELLPRKSEYGRFVGCSCFPKCTFIATNIKPYKGNDYK